MEGLRESAETLFTQLDQEWFKSYKESNITKINEIQNEQVQLKIFLHRILSLLLDKTTTDEQIKRNLENSNIKYDSVNKHLEKIEPILTEFINKKEEYDEKENKLNSCIATASEQIEKNKQVFEDIEELGNLNKNISQLIDKIKIASENEDLKKTLLNENEKMKRGIQSMTNRTFNAHSSSIDALKITITAISDNIKEIQNTEKENETKIKEYASIINEQKEEISKLKDEIKELKGIVDKQKDTMKNIQNLLMIIGKRNNLLNN